MKRLSITTLAVAALGVSVSAATVTATEITDPAAGALIYGEQVNLTGTVDAGAIVSDTYQASNPDEVAWAIRKRGTNGANAQCSGPGIVAGNVESFNDPASLDLDGAFSASVDIGELEAGLYCFALNLPRVGRDFVDFYIVDKYAKVGGTIRMGGAGAGNSPTHAFDGVIGAIGNSRVGSILVNYRLLEEYCNLKPRADVKIGEAAPGIGVTEQVRANGTFDNSCGGTADVWILGKDNAALDVDGETLRYPRGAIVIWDTANSGKYDVDLVPGVRNDPFGNWFPLERGNAEVGERPHSE